jgi:hypothetical protein
MLNISGIKLPMIGNELIGGKVLFVQSTHEKASNSYSTNGGWGLTPDKPLATLRYALTKCTAAKGDIIVCLPGHAETSNATTGTMTITPAGITILGVGKGDNRPTFTMDGAIQGFNITADDVQISNLRFTGTAATSTAASRLMRVAASDVTVVGCRFEHVGTTLKMYNLVVTFSGDNIKFDGCEFVNAASTRTATHAQSALLNISGTNVVVKNSRFIDNVTLATERWRKVVRGGAVGSGLSVEDCTFICRGIATAARAAAASTTGPGPVMSTIYCRAIAPSAGTAAGAVWLETGQYVIESYSVVAVNKNALIGVTTSDMRMKTMVMYL